MILFHLRLPQMRQRALTAALWHGMSELLKNRL